MPKRYLRRSLAALATPILAFALLLASTSAASAHEISDISATCDTVTVHFTGFPKAGVTVHIAATVEGHGTLSKDVSVDNTTIEAQLDISSATNGLLGATANVDVDVTWTFQGPQHAHKTLSVTCGSATTTTRAQMTTTTMSGVGGATSTTSTTAASVSGAQTGTTASGVLGESLSASPGVTASPTGGASLPRTGSSTLRLVIAALAALGAGTGLVITQRRRGEQS